MTAGALAKLIGEDPRIVAIRQHLARLVDPSRGRRTPPILLVGETGTGKGLLARAIHEASPRAAGPFVPVSCAAIPETLLESELFGIERGAFTDARHSRPGLVRSAHGGTLVLDEIALAPASVQAKLLKVVEDRSVRRLGSLSAEPVDVLLISATNEDLSRAVSEKRFRADLFHRLAGVTLTLPPLRERGRDIVLLAQHCLGRACADYGLPARRLSAEALAAVAAHPWPGNVRELANTMERAAMLAEGPVIGAEHLDLEAPAAPAASGAGANGSGLKVSVGHFERERLLEALEQNDWNISRAALTLDVPRTTLRYAMASHGLTPPAARPRRTRTRSASLPAPPHPVVANGSGAPEPEPGGERAGLGIGGRRLSPFVGREGEMALVIERLAQVRGGRGHVVGEPGAGKSRLLHELRERLLPGTVMYLEGRCLASGTAVPYLPVIDLLRRDWGIGEGEPAETVVTRVRERAREGGAGPEAVPYLLRLLGIRDPSDALGKQSPELIKRRTFDALRALILDHPQQRPMVLAVEDLHWVDRTSEELLGSLVDGLVGSRALMVTTYRPGYRPPWIDRSYATQLSLPPLSVEDSLTVARSVLAGDGPGGGLATEIVERAGGNPFFVEELARVASASADGRSLRGAVPTTVQAALEARMDRLPEGPRRTLETAAVLGREVPLALLERICDAPDDLPGHLAELLSREFLHDQSGPAGPLHVFKHALTQEVAYSRLAEIERRRLHAAAGRTLEAMFAGRLHETYDRLAFHYARTDDTVKAVDYLLRFGESAARSYALPEALQAFDEAASQVERLPAGPHRDRSAVQIAIAQATPLMIAGRNREARDRLLEEAERVERIGDPSLAGPYYFVLAFTHDHLGEHEAGAVNAQRALDEALCCGDRLTEGRAHFILAMGCFWTGRCEQGVSHAIKATPLLDGTDEQFYLGLNLWILGHNLAVLGEFDRAEEAAARAQATGEAAGDPRSQCYGLLCRGWIRAMRGEGETSLALCRSGLQHAPDPFAEAVGRGYLGYAHLQREEAATAVGLFEAAVNSWKAFHVPQLEGWIGAWLAEALLLEGDVGRARAQAGEALRTARAARFPFAIGLALAAQGRIAKAAGRLDEAAARLEESLDVLSAVGARYEAARARLDLAVVAHSRGQSDAAASHLDEARRAFETLRLRAWAERAKRVGAKLAGL